MRRCEGCDGGSAVKQLPAGRMLAIFGRVAMKGMHIVGKQRKGIEPD